MQTLPELRGTTQTELHTPRIYLPTKVPIVIDYVIKQLNDITSTELQKLDDVKSRVTTARQTMDRCIYTGSTEITPTFGGVTARSLEGIQ